MSPVIAGLKPVKVGEVPTYSCPACGFPLSILVARADHLLDLVHLSSNCNACQHGEYLGVHKIPPKEPRYDRT